MAYPNFSEFTFGYAIVRQIEEVLGGQTVVPSFPTQPEEASKGYDVSFLKHGVPLFIQFKRSEIMRRKSCVECKDKYAPLQPPIFRMHLHRANAYKQHFLMQGLESKGNAAVYCASVVGDKDTLDAHYSNGRAFDAATLFSPSDIILPSLDCPHHVSFCQGSRSAWIYSKEGARFDREIVDFGDILQRLKEQDDVPVNTQIDRLRELADDFDRIGPEELAQRQREKREYRRSPAQPSTESGEPLGAGFIEHEARSIENETARIERRARTRNIRSVVKRAAIEAFFEADALLVSVSRKALSQ